jgi:predicted dehydrogenase
LKVAVIGAGHLGKIHTRLAKAREDVELIGIVEPMPATRERVSAEFGVPGFADVREIWGKLDAAFVVTPTQYHHDVTRPLLERGIHCFVEKPITLSLADADVLITTARRRGVVLQVGHVERFNPALTTVKQHTRNVRYLEAARTSTYTFRSIDIGVVLDLMIHDIDIVLSLAQSEVVDVRAIGTPVFGPHEDMAQARLEFASGCVANLTASRTSYASQRTLQAVTPMGHVAIDLANRKAKVVQISECVARGEVDVNRVTADEISQIKEKLFVDYLPLTEVAVPEANAIADEQTDFVNAIREGRDAIVTGEQGRAALAVAYRILDAIHSTRRDTAHTIRPPHFAATPAITRKAG